jgi:hypothetical protein
MTEVSNAAELREVYLMAFDNMAVDPITVEQETGERIGSRFARELIGTLAQANVLVESEIGGETVWQTAFNVDDTNRAEVEAFIDEFLGIKKPKKAAKKATATRPATRTKDEGYHPCLCGCGENVPSKSNYRPGHDARHAGQIGKALAAMAEPSKADTDKMLADLPSDRLKDKALNIAQKQREKATKKNAKPESGSITVGKNQFDAVRYPDGKVVYTDAKGEQKTASKTAAASFAS